MGFSTTKKDVLWTYLAQILRIGNVFFLLPIVLRTIPTQELAIWYIFNTISSFIFLLDFGFSSTITRNVVYVFSGAKQLFKDGMGARNSDNEINYELLFNLIHTIKRIFFVLAVLVSIVLIIFGSLYINMVLKKAVSVNPEHIWIAWAIFIVTTSLNFYFLYLNSLLMGRGLVKEAQKAVIITNLSYIFLAYIGIILGYNLIAIVVANLISNIINRVVSIRYFYDKKLSEKINDIKNNSHNNVSLFSIIWFNAKKMGIVAIGAFLINKSSMLLIPIFLPLETVAQYGLTMQVVAFVSVFAMVYFTALIPKINALYYQREINSVKEQVGMSAFLLIGTFIFAMIGILLFGNKILLFIGSKTTLLPISCVIVIIFMNLLEQQHSLFATVLTFKNNVPFVTAAIFSGVAIIFSSIVLLGFTDLGIWAVILSQLIVQLAYNNWKWPYEVTEKMLHVNYFKLLFECCSIIIKKGITNATK
ncbi:MAG: hypothetical protein GX639_20405 [Fibrobacter sp.]|nr:hypothetical protein [Fibrobacter sp.]